ncbi:MAG TPA: hypothetical protein GXX19_12495 [Syntrophomonadaceae bacterium]|nr:hypothetical protein [Syntrophomonadaceae bacterium]
MGRDFFDEASGWEKGLHITLVLTFFFLLLLQVIFTVEPFRYHLSSTERLEGVVWSAGNYSGAPESGHDMVKIEIVLVEHVASPQVFVLINGRPAASFNKQRTLIDIREGDEILIDASRHKGPLTFRVKELSSEVLWPPSDYLVTTCSSCVSLGRVKMKKNYGGWGD